VPIFANYSIRKSTAPTIPLSPYTKILVLWRLGSSRLLSQVLVDPLKRLSIRSSGKLFQCNGCIIWFYISDLTQIKLILGHLLEKGPPHKISLSNQDKMAVDECNCRLLSAYRRIIVRYNSLRVVNASMNMQLVTSGCYLPWQSADGRQAGFCHYGVYLTLGFY